MSIQAITEVFLAPTLVRQNESLSPSSWLMSLTI